MDSASHKLSLIGADATRLVGRDADVARLRELLSSRDAPIVTIVGPAGVGKTRLAVELVDIADRPVVVALSDETSLARALDRMAMAIGLEGAPATDERAIDEIGRALRKSDRSVIVLDNCESLAAALAPVVSRWLDMAPGARFLVTSREPLGLHCEHRYELQALESEDAIALFEERAWMSAAKGGGPTVERHELVADIVRRLDCLPLAIELAAPRLGVLSLPELRELLAKGFDALRSDVRNRPARHSTLRAALDASWRLLDPAEQRSLARLSVMKDSLSLAAAQAVLAEGDRMRALDTLQDLKTKSLLVVKSDETLEHATRYALLETVREFAIDRSVELGERDGAAEAHARFFQHASHEWRDGLAGPKRALCVSALRGDLDNLFAAFHWLERSDRRAAVDIAVSIDGYLAGHGIQSARAELLRSARGLLGDDPSSTELATRLLASEASVGRRTGARTVTREMLDASLAGVRDAPQVGAQVHFELGCIARDEGDAPAAYGAFTDSLALAESAGDLAAAAAARFFAGAVSLEDQRPERAIGHLEWAAEQARKTGNRAGEAQALAMLAQCGRAGVELAEIRSRLGDALDAARARGAVAAHEASAANAATVVDLLCEDLEAAVEHATLALSRAKETGHALSHAGALCYLAVALHERGEQERAAELVAEGVALFANCRADQALASAAAAAIAAERRAPHHADLLERAQSALAQRPNATMRSARALVSAIAMAGKAGEHLAAGDLAAAAALVAEAGARLQSTEAASSGIELWFLRRVAQRAVRKLEGLRPEEGRTLVVVAEDASWLRVGSDGGAIDLSSRRTLGRILRRLVDERLQHPGAVVSFAALVEAAWPAERMLARAAKARLHTAIYELRASGLANLLVTRPEGYLLAPEASIVVCPVDGGA